MLRGVYDMIRDNIKEDNKILQWWFDLRGAPFGSDRGSIPQGSWEVSKWKE